MKITARADYAVLAVFELALRFQNGRTQAREIAERQQIPLRFLEQILIQLKRGGLVKSVRGASGGYILARLPASITLKDVLEAVEGDLSLLDPRLNPNSTVLRVWKEVESEFLGKLQSLSIEDLVRRKIREDKIVFYHI
ncbi:MAG: Rrf2 family transcriptional regulator [Acidobacteria bacterium]|nr:Rrf2 family transcriptional regulator [Acidobacteriota bacterium]